MMTTAFAPQPISENFVFHDHSKHKDDASITTSESDKDSVARGGVVTPFPWKVHDMLEKSCIDGIDHIVCWLPHGRAFVVHQTKEFVEQVMPVWFSQTKFASFQRQLNLYGFRRLTQGRDKGAYFHEHFLRGERNLIMKMSRQKIKGTKVRKSTTGNTDPNFWSMPFSRASPTLLQEQEEPLQQQQHLMHITVPNRTNSCGPTSPSNNCSPESSTTTNSGPPTPTLSSEEMYSQQEEGSKIDILFFEGKPFHYLDQMVLPQLLPHLSLGTTAAT